MKISLDIRRHIPNIHATHTPVTGKGLAMQYVKGMVLKVTQGMFAGRNVVVSEVYGTGDNALIELTYNGESWLSERANVLDTMAKPIQGTPAMTMTGIGNNAKRKESMSETFYISYQMKGISGRKIIRYTYDGAFNQKGMTLDQWRKRCAFNAKAYGFINPKPSTSQAYYNQK